MIDLLPEMKYVRQRKKQLKELFSLIYKRNELSRAIRRLQKEMNEWDIALVNGDKK